MALSENRHITHYIHIVLSMCIALMMPIYKKVLPAMIVLMGVNWIVMRVREGFKEFHFKKFTIAMAAFYVLHGIGLLWSENLPGGLFDMEVKMTFLFLPLMFATSFRMTQREVEWIMKAYLVGCTLVMGYLIMGAIDNYNNVRDLPYWFYGKYFVTHMHLGYFGLYLNFALCICVWFLTYGWNKSGVGRKVLWLLAIVFFSTAEIMTTSKNGIITLLLLYPMIGVFVVVSQKKYLLGLGTLAALGLIVASFLYFSPRTMQRFEAAWIAMTQGEPDRTSSESTAIRTFAWKSSVKALGENTLIGAGTGNVKPTLMAKYKEAGYTAAYAKEINAHNQFLQTGVALGILGMLSLSFIFLMGGRVAVLNKKRLLAIFLFIVVLYCLTESVFERQAGIVFFTFFVSILLFAKERRRPTRPKLK